MQSSSTFPPVYSYSQKIHWHQRFLHSRSAVHSRSCENQKPWCKFQNRTCFQRKNRITHGRLSCGCFGYRTKPSWAVAHATRYDAVTHHKAWHFRSDMCWKNAGRNPLWRPFSHFSSWSHQAKASLTLSHHLAPPPRIAMAFVACILHTWPSECIHQQITANRTRKFSKANGKLKATLIFCWFPDCGNCLDMRSRRPKEHLNSKKQKRENERTTKGRGVTYNTFSLQFAVHDRTLLLYTRPLIQPLLHAELYIRQRVYMEGPCAVAIWSHIAIAEIAYELFGGVLHQHDIQNLDKRQGQANVRLNQVREEITRSNGEEGGGAETWGRCLFYIPLLPFINEGSVVHRSLS